MVIAAALSISDAAEATGLSVHTLRYYERAGLMLDPVGRAPSSHRRYSEREIGWVTLLTRMRATGMPIRRIREYADLVRACARAAGTRRSGSRCEAHREAVLAQLDQMRRNLEAIDHKIEIYREPNFAARSPSGARPARPSARPRFNRSRPPPCRVPEPSAGWDRPLGLDRPERWSRRHVLPPPPPSPVKTGTRSSSSTLRICE